MISYVRNVGKTVLAAVVSLVFIVGAAGCGNTQKDDGQTMRMMRRCP